MVLSKQDIDILWDLYSGEAMIYLDDEASEELPSHCIDPEKVVIKKESFQKLSDESKEVIQMILDSPKEVLAALSTKSGLVTKRSVRQGLQKLWSSKFLAKYVIDEITNWVNKL